MHIRKFSHLIDAVQLGIVLSILFALSGVYQYFFTLVDTLFFGNLFFQLRYYLLTMFFIYIFRITISKNYYSFRFTFKHFKWETSVYAAVTNLCEMNQQILAYLNNSSNLSLSYFIHLNRDQSSIVIKLSRQRLFFPIAPFNLLQELRGLYSIWRIILLPTAKPKSSELKFFSLQFSSELPSLKSLVYSLSALPTLTQINIEVVHTNYIAFSVRVGYASNYSAATIKAILNGSTRYVSFGKQKKVEVEAYEVFKILKLPELPNLSYSTTPTFISHQNKFSFESEIGVILQQNVSIGSFGFSSSDFLRGGIIVGAIGTGKTNLRLQIMKYLQDNNIRIIDFDIKGDASRYSYFKGKRIVPKYNFFFNIFETPTGYSSNEYADFLYRTFLETLPDGAQLSSAQKSILYDALLQTLKINGTAFDFIENLLIVGITAKQQINNLQDSSAYALITKFSWLFTMLHNIFWTDQSLLTGTDYSQQSLFFDLSQLMQDVPLAYTRFLVDLILVRVLSTYASTDASNTSRLIIFLDEAQLLMPANSSKELSRLEEVVTTLRYKGISVIAAGVSSEKMSSVLADTGFLAQFRSESQGLHRALGLASSQAELIANLADFHCLVRSISTQHTTVQVHLDPFEQHQLTSREYFQQNRQATPKYLPAISFTTDYRELLDMKVFWQLNLPTALFKEIMLAVADGIQQQWNYLQHDVVHQDFESIFYTIIANTHNYSEFAIACITFVLHMQHRLSHKWLQAQQFLIQMKSAYRKMKEVPVRSLV